MMAAQLKHRWSISHNYLAGITAGDWWQLMRENRFAIAPAYWHRAAFITLNSLVNSWYWRKERRQYGDAIDAVQINQPPLFILGHWRSGTTLLHYLFAQDTSQFNFSNTCQGGQSSYVPDFRRSDHTSLRPPRATDPSYG